MHDLTDDDRAGLEGRLEERSRELKEMQREWEAKPGGRDVSRLNNLYAHRCSAIRDFIDRELLPALAQQSSGDQGLREKLGKLERRAVFARAGERMATLQPHPDGDWVRLKDVEGLL